MTRPWRAAASAAKLGRVDEVRRTDMGLFDKVKGLVRGNKKQIESGIDKGADMVTDKVGTEHADKVEKGADMAKDAVEKLAD